MSPWLACQCYRESHQTDTDIVISDKITCEMQSSLESQVVPGPGAKAMAIHCLSNYMAERTVSVCQISVLGITFN